MTFSALQILLGILEVPTPFTTLKIPLIGCGSADRCAIWGKFFHDLEDAPKPIVKHDRNWGAIPEPVKFCRKKNRRQSCVG